MELTTNIKCLKCFSPNASSMSYCRYCHAGFGYTNTADISEKANDDTQRNNNTLVIAAVSSLIAVTNIYLIFR